MMALCDMADAAGCSVYELTARMSASELDIRIVNRCMQRGYTFDSDKIAEMQRKKEEAETEAFLQRARAHWGK